MKVKTKQIKKSGGRRFAIGDIHGCHQTFLALIQQLNLQNNDQLFILGDFINRGPNSAQLINSFWELEKAGMQLYLLRGNHEHELLKAAQKEEKKLKKYLTQNNSLDLLEEGKEKFSIYLNFISKTYHYFELEDYFLVHAGFDFDSDAPFKSAKAMMYQRKSEVDKSLLKGKQIVVGHQPKKLSTIIKKIKHKKETLFIDNGCVQNKEVEQGNLICFNLDDKGIIVQPNCEK